MTSKMSHSQLLDLIHRRNEEVVMLMDIAKTLTSSLDLEEILSSILSKVGLLLKPKMWSLLLMDHATAELYFKIVVSPVADELKQIRLKVGEGIAGWVAAHGKPLLINDAQRDPRFARHVDDRVSFTTRSVICVPMKIKDRIVGVIELVNSLEDTHYEEADLTLLSAIADYAAIAIENARNYERLNEMVITDELTGLYNARHFNAIIDREIANAERYQLKLSLVFFDLDHFKNVNDSYGHLVGSRLLSEIGRLLKRSIRAADYGARFGGDEFVILLPNTDSAQARMMVSNLRGIINGCQFRADEGQPLKVTASFGIATYPDHASAKIELMRKADDAMYAVKEDTRDNIKVFGQ